MGLPNGYCDTCGKHFFRRPYELSQGYKHTYCSRDCLWEQRGRRKPTACPICKIVFIPNHDRVKFCSRACSNKGRKGIRYPKGTGSNLSQKRLHQLKEAFSFDRCMIVGCDYKKTFDIHRFIPGAQGGKYEIGNMFAICPNHHAEITRKIITVRKLDNQTLEIIDQGSQVRIL